jgi:hypothetical protein
MTLYVITGPPCAGKSTWVRQRAKPGDFVVDLDRIALAITAEGTPHHDYPQHIRKGAVLVRKQAVAVAVMSSRDHDSYVIHSKPPKAARAVYKRNGATFVHLSAPLTVLMERARAERPAWVIGAIGAWFDEPDA